LSDSAIAQRDRVTDSAAAANWRRVVEPYTGPDARRALFQLVSTLLMLAAVMWGIHQLLTISTLAALALTLPAAGLLIRTFIFMHDCAHGSFFASRRLNDTVGFFTGVLTLTPFSQWRRDHALHHASSGDLDRRGNGDVPTLTVREYLARTPGGQRRYRLLRNPALLLLGGPVHLALNQRFQARDKTTRSAHTSVWLTNLAILAFLAVAVFTVGWRTVLIAYGLPYYLAAMAGVWLFYIQHQFEDAYWTQHDEWDYLEAALRGSTHLQLPAVLQWFTGSIGLHHVHHASPKIPNYRLQACHDANGLFQKSPVVTLRSGLAALNLALWDETQGRMIRFRDLPPTSGT
jgi:omega-6 fatty acid desaturase (delta-12 desaturase)